jgi:hypothetical protein
MVLSRHAKGWHCAILATLACMFVCTAFEGDAHARQPRQRAKASTTPPDSAPRIGQCVAEEVEQVYIPMTGGSFEIVVGHGRVTQIRFPEWLELRNAIYPRGRFQLEENKAEHSIAITALEEMAPGSKANLILDWPPLHTNIDIRLAEEDEEYHRLIQIHPVSPKEYEQHKAEAEAARATGPDSWLAYRRGIARSLLSLEIDGKDAQGMAHAGNGFGWVAGSYVAQANPGSIRATLGVAMVVKQPRPARYWMVTIDNRGHTGITIDHVMMKRVGTYKGTRVDIEWDESARFDDGALVVDAGHQARGMILVPEEMTGALNGLKIHFMGVDGLPLLADDDIVQIWPPPNDLLRRQRMSTQVTVSLRGLFGGFWTGDAAGQDRVAGTTMVGFGARVQKGYQWGGAFEGEVIAARSGDARFEEVSWNGLTGDITRHATFGRAMGGFAMRVGHDLVLTGRVGLGVQLTDYDSILTMGGIPVTGPGNGLEVDGVWSVGTGVDARIGEHWILGAAVNFADAFNTDARSFEGGIHIGYGINAKQELY